MFSIPHAACQNNEARCTVERTLCWEFQTAEGAATYGRTAKDGREELSQSGREEPSLPQHPQKGVPGCSLKEVMFRRRSIIRLKPKMWWAGYWKQELNCNYVVEVWTLLFIITLISVWRWCLHTGASYDYSWRCDGLVIGNKNLIPIMLLKYECFFNNHLEISVEVMFTHRSFIKFKAEDLISLQLETRT